MDETDTIEREWNATICMKRMHNTLNGRALKSFMGGKITLEEYNGMIVKITEIQRILDKKVSVLLQHTSEDLVRTIRETEYEIVRYA